MKQLKSVLAALFALTLVSTLSWSQSFQASITGTVKDPSGGVVPAAQLTATEIATGTSLNTTSNEAGVYRFNGLKPGQYRLTCSVAGFKKFEQSELTLQVNQTLEVNPDMQPGQTTEQVTVSAAPPPLDTASATVGQVVTTRSIENLPLNVRDPLALVGLTPGVTFGGNFGNAGGTDVGRGFYKSDFNVGGGRSGFQEVLIDGAPDTTGDRGLSVVQPPVDSVQEFKVQANSYDAQFGRTSGGVVNLVTKAGTNDLHGVAYGFERHSIFDANNFFNNRSGVALPSFKRHQFGANVAGPVIKNKWFFFGDYEGLRQGYPQTRISTVATALQRAGNFSQTFASNGQLIQIYDPLSTVTLSNGTRQRTPFAGNVIPSNRIDPVSAATVALYPLPNTPGTAITSQNNYVYSSQSITNSDKYDIRSDLNISDNTRLFGRFSRQQDTRLQPGAMPPPIGGGRSVNDHFTQAMIDLTHVFSPTLISDVQFSFSRALGVQYGLSQGFDLSSLKLPGYYTTVTASQFPIFNIADITGTSNGNGGNGTGSDAIVSAQPRNIFATLGSISYQRGKHSLKFGGDWRVIDFNEGQNANPSGTFGFTRGYTQGPNALTASSTSGFGFASFLLGDPASGTVNRINNISTQGLYFGAYVQDDWRVTDRLTLNIGLRWDVQIGDREKYNRLAYFNPDAINPLGALSTNPAYANLKGVLSWVGQGNPQNQQSTDWRDFGPRFGFAYSADPKTVIRGGYGIFFVPRIVAGTNGGAVEAVRTTTMLASVDGVIPTNTLSNPYPGGVLPPLNDRNPLVNVGQSVTAPIYGFKNAYVQLWSFGVQRDLGAGIVADFHYWGNKGQKLPNTWNINQLPNQYLALGSRLTSTVPNPFLALNLGGAFAGPTISLQQSLLPYPQYTGVQQVYSPTGNSNYHAFTAQAEKRLSTNLTFLANYTWAKAIDDVRTPLDIYNRRAERGLSGFDVRHMIRLSGVWSIPFGHDRQYGKGVNPILNAILGGWNLDPIINLQSGLPISVSRPSVNNGQSAKLDNPSINAWLNTSVFTVAPAFNFGNVGPILPDVRTDFQRNIDAVLVKNFGFSIVDHAVTAQFRWEVYNVFNTPVFGFPGNTVGSQTFGIVSSTINSPRDMQFALKLRF